MRWDSSGENKWAQRAALTREGEKDEELHVKARLANEKKVHDQHGGIKKFERR